MRSNFYFCDLRRKLEILSILLTDSNGQARMSVQGAVPPGWRLQAICVQSHYHNGEYLESLIFVYRNKNRNYSSQDLSAQEFLKIKMSVQIDYTSNSSVPATIRQSPAVDFLLSFSFKIKLEKAMVTTILSLSIGTTTLACPSCNAL